MASEILLKSRAVVTAQANTAALTAGYDPNSGSYTNLGAVIVLNNGYAASENCKGAHFLSLELNVTAAPSTQATAEVWYSVSEDDTNYTYWKYSHTIGDPILITTARRYDGGIFELSAKYTKLAVKSVSYAFTAALLATPKLYEAQV